MCRQPVILIRGVGETCAFVLAQKQIPRAGRAPALGMTTYGKYTRYATLAFFQWSGLKAYPFLVLPVDLVLPCL